MQPGGAHAPEATAPAQDINELNEASFSALILRGSAVSEDGKWRITRVVDRFDHFTYTLAPVPK